MASRIREKPDKIFEIFTEIGRPSDDDAEPFILQLYPESYSDEDVLKSVSKFAFPCSTENAAVDHFTFVLTDIDGKFRFGFCRHATGAQTCLCIISFLPWFEIFYKLLNFLAEVLNRSESNNIFHFLDKLYNEEVPSPGVTIDIVSPSFNEKFSFITPDTSQLPSIPESRNLTEYYNAVDANNMLILFASMLYERRILITSKKLSRLTACIHGSAALIYPMYWQHLYIPVLPPHLLDYCSAPMPYIVGVHSSLMPKVYNQELGDAVIFNADTNQMTAEYDDLSTLPTEVVSALKKRLRSQQSEKTSSNLLGYGVSKAFLKAMVALIGGYRDALRFRPGEQITFDPEAFVLSRHSSWQPFLETTLHLQIFEQFINDRLDMLNAGQGFSDEFEIECNSCEDKWGTKSRYKEWLVDMKRQGKKLRREGKDKWVEFASKVKVTGKKAFKDIRNKIDELKKEEEHGISRNRTTVVPVPGLKTQRPPRPPPPDMKRVSGLSPFPTQRQSIVRRTSYEQALGDDVLDELHDLRASVCSAKQRRTRHYKVISVEDYPDSPTLSTRLSRRISSDDSQLPDVQRVSLDLMGDPDIQIVIKKSYSLEDLAVKSRKSLSSLDEVDETADVTVFLDSEATRLDKNDNLSKQSDELLATMLSVPGRDNAQLSRASSSSPELLDSVHTTLPRMPSTGSLPIDKPIPAPRLSKRINVSEQPLIKLDSIENEPLESSQISHCPAGPELQFDPLTFKLQMQDAASTSDTDSVSSNPSSTAASLDQDVTKASRPKLRSRPSLSRQNAFYNASRPPSYAGKLNRSQTCDSQTSQDIRKAFIECEVTRGPTLPGNTDLDQFDPLVLGRVAMDTPQSRASPIDRKRLSDESDDNLLKEWNLDFDKMKVTAHPIPPIVPAKPITPPVGQNNALFFNNPTRSYSTTPPVYYTLPATARHNTQHTYKSPNVRELVQQFSSSYENPPLQPTPVSRHYSAQSRYSYPGQGTQHIPPAPRNPQVQDPFGDLLHFSGVNSAQHLSTPQADPRSSWETFD